MKKFFFYPKDKNEFFARVEGNYARTLVFQPSTNKVITFCRDVNKWNNSRKNQIQSDSRIKKLDKNNTYHIYTWISDSNLILHFLIFQKMKKKYFW